MNTITSQMGNKINNTGKFSTFFGKVASMDADSEDHNIANELHRYRKNNHPFLKGLQPIVLLGRIFGLLSRTDVLNHQDQKRKLNLASVISGSFAFFFFVNAILIVIFDVKKFQQDQTTLVRVEGFRHCLYACSMSFVYCYQFIATSKLRKIVQTIASEPFPPHKNSRLLTYPKFCLLAMCVGPTFGITENALFDWQNLSRPVKEDDSVLHRSYINYFTHWHIILPYNSVVTFVMIIIIKLGTWGWVHMDSVCIALCRALWEKLGGLEDTIESALNGYQNTNADFVTKIHNDKALFTEQFKHFSTPTSVNWDGYQDQYIKICRLVEQVEKYIYPLMLACYIGNTFHVIVLLFNWIGPLSSEEKFSKEQFSHICFGFLQYLFRVSSITYFAAEVHQKCLLIRKIIHCCPKVVYTSSAERLERTLAGNPAGITLLGCVIVKRKFFVSILSFIFTAEIVLLQTYATYHVAKTVSQPH